MDPQGLTQTSSVLDWAVAARALPGQRESGDLYAVVPTGEGVLVAVVDGLGHGPEAAEAARCAVATLQAHADEPLATLVRRCHTALLKTRGVVFSVASLSRRGASLEWVGVGNVEGVLLRADLMRPRANIHLRGGVVGYQLPVLRPTTEILAAGDTLFFATDGIRSEFTSALDVARPPRQVADRILARYARDNDDALVLVARYLGIEA